MKLGILKERGKFIDSSIVISPAILTKISEKYPQIAFKIEYSPTLTYSIEEYGVSGIVVDEIISDCDVFIGIEPLPVASLIPNKAYLFLENGTEKSSYTELELQTISEQKIVLFDFEDILNFTENTVVNLEYYNGIVGLYHVFRAFGIKYELFKMPKSSVLLNKSLLIGQLKKIVLPPLKIMIIGNGQINLGVKEMLESMKIKKVSLDDAMNKKFSQPVYIPINLDGNEDWIRYSYFSDILIVTSNSSSVILSQDALRSKDCKLKVVIDISEKNVDKIACILKNTTTKDFMYGYLPNENREVDWFHPGAIVVVKGDNLFCELPKEDSEKLMSELLELSFRYFIKS